MSAFKDMLRADAAAILNVDEFGEVILYTPVAVSSGNQVRSISAIVDRDPPAVINADPNYAPAKMVIMVLNDPVLGISSATINTGGDTVTIAYRIGGTSRAYSIKLSPGQTHDIGMMRLELR